MKNHKEHLYGHLQADETEIYMIIQMILPEYRLLIFKEIGKFLNIEDYSLGLRYAYMKASGLNSKNAKLTLDEVLNLFDNADKDLLMEEDTQEYYNLPPIVTIYRGSPLKNNTKAISWTLDRKRAIWFYKKYESKGCVYKAKIKKENIKCYLDKVACCEKEVVVDYKKIYDIEKLSDEEIDDVQDFSEFDSGSVNMDYVIQASQHILQQLANFGILPTKELAEEVFKSYQTRGEYKSNYVLTFFTGEQIILHELLEKLEEK